MNPDSSTVTERRSPSNRPTGPFFASIAASAAVFGALTAAVRSEGPIPGDGLVEFFDEHYYDFETGRLIVETTVEATIGLGAAFAVVLLGVLLVRRAFRRAAFWGLAMGGAVLLTRILKELIERPEIGTRDVEYSFPSGNATASLAGVLALILLLERSPLRRGLTLAAIVTIPLYGLALVLLLWHYPSDVVAGWALATAWVLALRLAFGRELESPAPTVRRLP